MNNLAISIRWDLIRQVRYNILASAVVVNLLYVLIMLNLPEGDYDWLAIFLIFNDPMGLGLMFVGALYLFEKSENTLQALNVTPLRHWQYLLSKVLTLSAIALAGSLVIGWAAYGWWFHYGYFLPGAGLSATMFTMLGICVAVHCRTFNDYLLRAVGVILPMALPLLNYFGITESLWWYLLPSQASIILLEASFEPVEGWKLAYAFIYLAAWNVGAYLLAIRILKRQNM
ncbi:MAG: ABC transporter permease [Phaeodactylibacter sp.]|nr:ABC transporter permease [Phaeodactylibacter sp.]MCB9273287.1 ABC transporter permease [Lewinellaceae bacterium]